MKEMTFAEAINYFSALFKKANPTSSKRSEYFGYVNFLANIDKILDLANIQIYPQYVIWFPKEHEKSIIKLQQEGLVSPLFLFGNTKFFIKLKGQTGERKEEFNPDFILFNQNNKIIFFFEIKGKKNQQVVKHYNPKTKHYQYTAYKIQKRGKSEREKIVETKERYQCLIYLQSFNLLYEEGVSNYLPIVFLVKTYRNGIYIRLYQSLKNQYKTKLDNIGETFISQRALLV